MTRSNGWTILSRISAADSVGLPSTCPSCGFLPLAEPIEEVALYRPWHLRNFAALQAYTATLSQEMREWVLALFVNDELGLLTVETVACGSISGAKVNIGQLICRGRSLRAAGFFLVHNHPSGDPTPSVADINFTRHLANTSAHCDMPMLCHVIVAKDGMKAVGGW